MADKDIEDSMIAEVNDSQEAKDDAYTMLSAAVRLSPNGIIQERFQQMFNNMRMDGLMWDSITIKIGDAMMDGLKYGNWPGTTLTEKPK